MKIKYKDKKVEAEFIDFKPSKEEWNTYELEDGTKLRVKLVMVSVYRLKDEYIPETEEPIYVIKSENVLSAKIPEELLKK